MYRADECHFSVVSLDVTPMVKCLALPVEQWSVHDMAAMHWFFIIPYPAFSIVFPAYHFLSVKSITSKHHPKFCLFLVFCCEA